MAPLAPYVELFGLNDLDAVSLSQQTFQAIPVPLRLEGSKLAHEGSPRIALVSIGNLILATVEKSAWDFYLRAPVPKTPLPECEVARRELTHALQRLSEPDLTDLTETTPWDVMAETAGIAIQRSVIAGMALQTIVQGRLGSIGLDAATIEATREIALSRIRETELALARRQHLQAFLAGHEPFDGIAKVRP